MQIIEQFTDPGYGDGSKPNDDCIGVSDKVAVVADGATGLSDKRLLSVGESDAQAVARLIVTAITTADPMASMREVVGDVISKLRDEVLAGGVEEPPRYAWPASGFIAARRQGDLVEVSGLGDCSVLVLMHDGSMERFCPLPDNHAAESGQARLALAARKAPRKNEAGEAIRTLEIVEELRRKRARLNTVKSGVWTVSLVEEAADHIMSVAIPASEVAFLLLMSDGFAAAAESYGIADFEGLMRMAREEGLAEINRKIRHIERVEDPFGEAFPRYKQSDDSTAILVNAEFLA